jgi:hypothetical protein
MDSVNDQEIREKTASQASKKEFSNQSNRMRQSYQEERKNQRIDSNMMSKEKFNTERKNDNFSVKDQAFGDPSSTLKKVLQKMIDVKKSNIHLSKSILNDKAAIIKKEKLLAELNTEINHFKKENEKLKEDLDHTEKVKAKCQRNEKGVKAYCNTLRGKFKDFVETVLI